LTQLFFDLVQKEWNRAKQKFEDQNEKKLKKVEQ
jgi:hypothetical protein